jgi:hypothetical protein
MSLLISQTPIYISLLVRHLKIKRVLRPSMSLHRVILLEFWNGDCVSVNVVQDALRPGGVTIYARRLTGAGYE